MTILLKPAPKAVAKILDKLAEGLVEPGQSKVIDNTAGTFMPVHVETTMRDAGGAVFSVAHYFEANGDLVADPEMELLRDGEGQWYPLSLTMTFGRRQAVHLQAPGKPRVDEREYRGQLRFLATWMKNIREQQGL